jgi:RNA polymerase sigma-70 factor (ECF subfamily)
LSENDEHILIRIRAGDEECFIQLVDTYKKKIIALCYSYTKDSHEAEDLSQEVFISFYKNIDNFRGDCSISTYIYKIAVRKCLDFKKKRSMKSMLIEVFKDKGKSEELDDKIFIRQCIDELPKDIKVPVILFYYVGLNQKEIGKVLNITQKAVEGRIYRGKQKLKDKLLKGGNIVCSKSQII